MGTRFILEASVDGQWTEVKDVDQSLSKEQMKSQAATVALAIGHQTRIRKVTEKIMFTSTKPLKTMVNAA